MKKIHRLVVKSFIGPFIVTFAISLFFLLMQFVWLWIDEFVGKGLDIKVIIKILYYASAALVPMALPLAVLLASVMTFGNLSEHFELTAMKTSGISLWRIMSPLIFFIALLSIGAFFFSNNVLPYTNLKYAQLLYDISRKRPEMSIKTGVFNNEIDGYSIKADRKNTETGIMYDFMIYNHTKRKGNTEVTVADSGQISITTDQKNMIVTLYSGINYNEMKEKDPKNREYPYRRDKFTKETIIFRLPDNSLKKSNERMFKKHYEIMNSKQLSVVIDSLSKEYIKRKKLYEDRLTEYNYFKYEKKVVDKQDTSAVKEDSLIKYQEPEKLSVIYNLDNIYNNMDNKDKLSVIRGALKDVQITRSNIENNGLTLTNRLKWLKKHQLAWYKKLSLSFACLVFFFIGAPLGAIIRKGGFGMPFLVSIVLFMFYYILMVMGEKAAVESALPVFAGAWLASGILFPLGVFITYKATKDSKIVNTEIFDNILNFLGKILKLGKY